jgi:hypothetical protein
MLQYLKARRTARLFRWWYPEVSRADALARAYDVMDECPGANAWVLSGKLMGRELSARIFDAPPDQPRT